jgi:hypothetical protein
MFSENPFRQPSVDNDNEGTNSKKDDCINVPKDSVPKDSDASERFRPFRLKTVPKDSVHHNNENDTTKPNNSVETIPAVLNVTNKNQVPPPIYTISGQHQFTEEVLQTQEKELNSWEKDLERREEILRNHPSNPKANNWPPVPTWCHKDLKPCFYQDIKKDFDSSMVQTLVQNLYYLWIAHTSLLLVNLLIGTLYLFVGGDNGETFGLSLICFVLYTPLSFVCWFRAAYKAFKDDSSLKFMLFFFVFSVQLLVSIFYALGIGKTGSCGLILGISLAANGETGGKVFVGACMIIAGFGFAICAMCDYYLLIKIHRVYRTTGGSIEKAKSEFTSGVMRNDEVQGAVVAAAMEMTSIPGNTKQ